MATFEFRMIIAGLALLGTTAVPALADEAKKTVRSTEIRTVIHDSPDMKSASWSDGQEMKVDCPGALTVIEASAGNSPAKKEKARMVFCTKSGDKSEVAAGLEQALARVEGDTEMNGALRADVAAKLRARITELRTVE